MKIRIEKAAVLLFCVFVSKTFAQNVNHFSFSPNPAESRDHLILSFPEDPQAVIDGLVLSIQATTDLSDWSTTRTVYFELNATNEIEGFLIGSELRATESGDGLEMVWVKKKELYASVLWVLNNEPLSYVSEGTKEIFIFIGNYVFTEVKEGNLILMSLEYTERTPKQFFRIVPSTLTVTD